MKKSGLLSGVGAVTRRNREFVDDARPRRDHRRLDLKMQSCSWMLERRVQAAQAKDMKAWRPLPNRWMRHARRATSNMAERVSRRQ